MSDQHRAPDEIALLAMAKEDDAERVRFAAHAEGCASCAREWQRAGKLAALMGTLATPPPPSDRALARTRARVHAALAAEPRPAPAAAAERSPMARFAVGAAVLVSVVLAFSMTGPAISAYRMLLAIATIGVAALLPGLALRSDRDAIRATAGALALSFTLAWLDYTEIPLVAGHAVGCMTTELVIGALPLLSMLALARGAGARAGAFTGAAAGACGALAGQGVLLTTCGADESVLHVLVFHVAGVALAALLGGGLGTALARRA